MYELLVVAYPQSMVRKKNFPKATAPLAECCCARTGMTGTLSRALPTFGPVRGTSAGTVGRDVPIGVSGTPDPDPLDTDLSGTCEVIPIGGP